ncbi:VCBS repeat-containing protein [bacterium]|nr:MAG: VCBS repeat-containing protein [bacterium]
MDSANYLSGIQNPSTVFLHGGVPRVPRRVETLDRTGATYKEIVSAFLARKGVIDPKVSIQKLIRVDLDGDGTKEVLIEARNRDDFNLSQMKSDLTDRDYSLVLLRSVRGKGVFEFPLEFVSKRSDVPMDIRRLRGVADIDGDGRMEIVTDSRGYEWQHGSLWKYGKGAVRKVVTQYGGH